MQNRYAGDVGDFLKLGLLRHLAASASMSVGLNWYLVPDETHNGDGKHIGYLDPASRLHGSFADCDADLLARLARVVRRERSVDALELCGALPAGSRTHSEMLDLAPGEDGRGAWHSRALAALAGADVVLADPDNGIRAAAAGSRSHKYALLTELADYAARGQSVIAYQHADRSADARTQARVRLAQLAAGVGQCSVGAIVAHRGSCRFFLATADDGHRAELAQALNGFAASWEAHVELVR